MKDLLPFTLQGKEAWGTMIVVMFLVQQLPSVPPEHFLYVLIVITVLTIVACLARIADKYMRLKFGIVDEIEVIKEEGGEPAPPKIETPSPSTDER